MLVAARLVADHPVRPRPAERAALRPRLHEMRELFFGHTERLVVKTRTVHPASPVIFSGFDSTKEGEVSSAQQSGARDLVVTAVTAFVNGTGYALELDTMFAPDDHERGLERVRDTVSDLLADDNGLFDLVDRRGFVRSRDVAAITFAVTDRENVFPPVRAPLRHLRT